MNTKEYAPKYNAIEWVKNEIDQGLDQVRIDIETYIESRDDVEAIGRGITKLKQIRGTLEMIEINGGVMLSDELISILSCLQEKTLKREDDALGEVMRALIQFGDYLEYMQSGNHDIPIILLPLLNDLRAQRDADFLSEKLLTITNLENDKVVFDKQKVSEENVQELAKILRPTYQFSLVGWFTKQDYEQSLLKMAAVCNRLFNATSEHSAKRLWWISQGIAEALHARSLDTSTAVKQLMGKVDRQIKSLAQTGEAEFAGQVPEQLVKNLLFYIASASAGNVTVNSIKKIYQLTDQIPSENALENARTSLSGPNANILKSLVAALHEDILVIKDGIEIYSRAATKDVETLKMLPQEIIRLTETLTMLGMVETKKELLSSSELIQSKLDANEELGDEAISVLANSLVRTELNVDALMSKESGAETAENELGIDDAAHREVIKAATHESLIEISLCKESLLDYIRKPNDLQSLSGISERIERVKSVMSMLPLQHINPLLESVQNYLNTLTSLKSVPEGTTLNSLADVITSTEFYLEMLNDNQGDHRGLLDAGFDKARELDQWVENMQANNPDSVDDVDSTDEVDHEDADDDLEHTSNLQNSMSANTDEVELVHQITQEIVNEAAVDIDDMENDIQDIRNLLSELTVSPEEFDEEIFEIFLEEAESEIESINEQLPLWLNAMDNTEPLTTVRRSYHTLKGSGRLVGAQVLGEYAWVHENLINRILENTLMPTAEIVECLGKATILLPELVQQLNDDERPGEHIIRQMAWAEYVKRGKPEKKKVKTQSDKAPESTPTISEDISVEEAFDVSTEVLDQPEAKADSPDEPLVYTTGLSDPIVEADYPEHVEKTQTQIFENVFDGDQQLVSDNALLEIYRVECEQHRQTIINCLEGKSEHIDFSDELIRALHTLNGSSRTANVPELYKISGHAEHYIYAIQEMEELPVDNFKHLLYSIIEQIDNVTDVLKKGGEIPVNKALEDELENLYEDSQKRLSTFRDEQRAIEAQIEVKRAIEEDMRKPLSASQQESAFMEAQTQIDMIVNLKDLDVDDSEFGSKEVVGVDEEAISAELVSEADDAPVDLVADMGAFDIDSVDEISEPADVIPVEASVGEQSPAISEMIIAVDPEVNEELDHAGIDVPDLPPADLIIDADTFDAGDMVGLDASVGEQSPAIAEAVIEAGVEAQIDEIPVTDTLDEADDLLDVSDLRANDIIADVDNFDIGDIDAMGLMGADASSNIADNEIVPSSMLDEAEEQLQSVDLLVDADEFDAKMAVSSDAPVDADTSDSDDPSDQDADLLEIFTEEAFEIIDHSDEALRSWSSDVAQHEPVADLLRHLHTLKGGARMAGMSNIGDLSHSIETLLNAGVENRLAMDNVVVETVQRSFDHINKMLQMCQVGDLVPPATDILNDISRLVGDSPDVDPMSPTEFAGSPVTLILDEVTFAELSDDVVDSEVESAPVIDDIPELDVEVPVIVDEANAETEAAEETTSNVATTEEIPVIDDDVLVAPSDETRLNDVYTPEAKAKESQKTPPSPVTAANKGASTHLVDPIIPTTVTESIQPVRDVAPASIKAEYEKLEKSKAKKQVKASQQEIVRVRSMLLDNLLNSAGEVNIYRSRIEEQIMNVQFNLQELETTIDRLSTQLRKLEGEAEAQILANLEVEGIDISIEDLENDPNAAFIDPLEMDRYSNMQQLSRSLAESINDLVNIKSGLLDEVRDTEKLLLQQSRVSTALQEGLMRTRMVQFSELVPRLRRIVRQTARELEKKVEIKVSGEQVELDRNVLESMVTPLEHILRNALAHGIETPADRKKAKKDETGLIKLNISREGGEVIIQVEDDGNGIDADQVRDKAISQGLIDADTSVTDKDAYMLIMEPGFSTAEKISQIAGRGVGMDIVHAEVRRLKGVLDINSEKNKFTRFSVRLPFTLAISQAMLVDVMGEHFAIPLNNVESILRIKHDEAVNEMAAPNPKIEYANHEYHLKSLSEALGIPNARIDSTQETLPVILSSLGESRVALIVDTLIGRQEVVVKSLGPMLGKSRTISGATVLGDGSVVLILDMAELSRATLTPIAATKRIDAIVEPVVEEVTQKTVMVVDDSITIRKVTTRMLERNDYIVVTAKDGVDAVSVLQDVTPDLMLLDIEMPRMDGYELATHIRNQPDIKDLPIIMITSRTGQKHKDRAMEIGVNMYLGKPYQEQELLDNIEQTLEQLSQAAVENK